MAELLLVVCIAILLLLAFLAVLLYVIHSTLVAIYERMADIYLKAIKQFENSQEQKEKT